MLARRFASAAQSRRIFACCSLPACPSPATPRRGKSETKCATLLLNYLIVGFALSLPSNVALIPVAFQQRLLGFQRLPSSKGLVGHSVGCRVGVLASCRLIDSRAPLVFVPTGTRYQRPPHSMGFRCLCPCDDVIISVCTPDCKYF